MYVYLGFNYAGELTEDGFNEPNVNIDGHYFLINEDIDPKVFLCYSSC
jgi:hypothetical protein